MNNDPMEKELLKIAQRIQAIAQTGIRFANDTFDMERYTELRELSVQMVAHLTDAKIDKIRDLFTFESGFQTPKVDIRAVVLRDNKILLTQEKSDHKWALPGGYADVNYSPAEVAIKEVYEETGIVVKASRILAIVDANRHNFPPLEYHFYKIIIRCEYLSGDLRGSNETDDTNFFAFDSLPELSVQRNSYELMTLIQAHLNTELTYMD